jgi:phospholipid-binding lipoprotein MlaA
MSVEGLSILGRMMAAAVLAAGLSACAASGPNVTRPELLASHTQPADAKGEHAAVDAPTDVASLPDEPDAVRDPFEKMNRSVFERNQRFNHAVIYPVAKAYVDTVPEGVRNSVESFAGNLAEPMVFANDLLQLRLKAAATTASRFAINSTLGVGGLFDVAARKDLPRQSGDLGQTLYVWGVRKSPYLVLPVIGPTNVRDLIGTAGEFIATIPAGGLFGTQLASTVNNLTVAGSVASPFTKLGQADQMEALEDSSIDFYSSLRSVVDQKRQAELQEALETSGWTAGRYAPSPTDGQATTSVATLAGWKVTVPATKEQEMVANMMPGAQ